MLQHIKNLLKASILYIAIAITILILYLSLFKMPGLGIKIINIDKVYHSIAYFTLTLSWLFAFYKKPNYKYFVLFTCIIFGIVVEVFQYVLTNYRTADYIDAIANSIGALLALVVFNLFFRKKEIK